MRLGKEGLGHVLECNNMVSLLHSHAFARIPRADRLDYSSALMPQNNWEGALGVFPR